MPIMEDICFGLAHHLVSRRDKSLKGKSEETGNIAGSVDLSRKSNWYAWRANELRQQFEAHFDRNLVAGKDVLDFGCGGGFLSLVMAEIGAKSAYGLDIRPDHIEQARSLVDEAKPENPPIFVHGEDDSSIPFPDNSFDVILCFDVLEHIMAYKEIIPEWKRILRPGGRILIWWQPHFHPYGHHLMTYIPIPWAHVFFSKKTLANTCSRVFDSEDYVPRFWDCDASGKKLASRDFKVDNLGGINGLTVSHFEKLCRQLELKFIRRQAYAFRGGKIMSGLSGMMSKLPIGREFFTAYMIYEISY